VHHGRVSRGPHGTAWCCRKARSCRWYRNSGMSGLQVDYTSVLDGIPSPPIAAQLGPALLSALAERYEAQFPRCSLVEFVQSGATYLFDLASAAGAEQEDRTVAAWTVTPETVAKRDASYQRGFPLPPGRDGALVDRGHLIPHLSGGEFGPNIFRQNRALNRGWSPEGRQFRALEREAANAPGASTSATSSTKTAPPTPPKSRPGCSAAGHCTSSGSVTGSRTNLDHGVPRI
jgi:hypothetical protein